MMNSSAYCDYCVTPSERGVRLDRFLQHYLKGVPYGTLQKWFRLGRVRLNSKKVKGDERMACGDIICYPNIDLSFVDERSGYDVVRATDADCRMLDQALLFENDWFLAFCKPHGLAVQGGTGQRRSFDGLMNDWNKKRGGVEALRLVHRLDKDTSGVLLIAKTRAAAQYLTAAFQDKTIDKQYLAVTSHRPPDAAGVIEAAIEKAYGSLQEKMVVSQDGQAAKTSYRVLSSNKGMTLLGLSPSTGRTHQLRVHMNHVDCPLLGDGKYGGSRSLLRGERARLHLHAHKVSFKGMDNEIYSITAPIPDFFQKTLTEFGLSFN